jgi:hypothetical protein
MSNQLVLSGGNQGNDKIQEEANALIQNLSIVPSTNNSHTVANNQSNLEFEVNVMGNMTDCDFYIPDKSGDNTALAFRVAYEAAKTYYCNGEKKLCAYVGSMLCSVVPGLRESVEEALIGIGIWPRFVSLPSQAHDHNIVESKFRVLAEVDKFEEACIAISSSHFPPQFFNHICSVSDLHYFDRLRFPTLFAVALELEKGRDGSSLYNVGDSAVFIGTNRRKVNDLVKLHWKAMEGTYNSLERYKRRFFIRGL